MSFRASGHNWRLYCGSNVLEDHLREVISRAGAKRAFVVCSPSINRRTDIVGRIEKALGPTFAGVFDQIEKDCPYPNVCAARDAAREANADLLVAVGGGSVLVATRAVAIFLGEDRDPFELMTQYPADKPAYSPRLAAPKMPIVNIPTTPTSAMNRAGTGLKNADLDHRMEFFDPKTRPQAILLDYDVLMTTPSSSHRSTATTVFSSLVGAIAAPESNPLVEGDRLQAFRLAFRAYSALAQNRDDAASRADLCVAAFLQNRAEDDGARLAASSSFGGDYAVSTALHVQFPHVGQGESISTIHATKIRLSQDDDAAAAQVVAEALGLNRDSKPIKLAIADELERLYRSVGMPIRLSELNIPRSAIPLIAGQTVKNFNANAGVRSDGERIAAAQRLLEAAY
ncbi:MAG: iron-containing alcohol dehydrogenase [Reyranella sp.]|nr:iron-containing alcohol dehydrogenase [Reyranella sp.]